MKTAAWLAIVVAGLLWSALGAFDVAVWAMEVAPVFIVVPLLAWTRRRFTLTELVYVLILVHALILMVGGHYSYARVPLGFWMQEWFGFARNNYDRIGHLAQGFIPAMVAREILLRKTPLVRGGWLFFIVSSVCLAISAMYEFIEWGAAVALGQGADEFLATQGDPFDTQSDMLMAWIGSMLAQILLSRWHDRQLAALPTR
jgi:putative membrane protein